MKRFFSILTLLFVVLSASAQMEHSIVLDRSSFRAVQTDALTGVNIDPIREDSSREPCARLKIKFERMNRAQVDALEVKFRSNTDIARQDVAQYFDNVLILEISAKPNTRFFVVSPEFGESNEITLDLEANREYEMFASLNQTFSIVVNSNVANADVYIDNNFKGQTDSSNSLTIKDVLIGGHTLKVVYGSVSNQKNIDVNSGSISFRVNVDTAANEPQFVVFTVEPAVALVLIDNKPYTVTDGAMQVVLESGTYNYTVTAEGYHPKSGTFTVAGEKVVNQVFLTADALSVTLNAPNGAEIWINGEKKGVSRWSGILNSGTYIFEARKAGHKSASLTKTISSQVPMQSFTLPAPTPITGSIVVSGTPIMADVALDGKVVGQTPVKLGNILVGEHKITISKDGYKTNTQTITVAEGKSTTVNVALTKLNAQSSNTTTAATPTYPYITAKESIIIDTQNISSIVDSDNHMGIGHDMAYRPCARVKILFDKMSADEIKKLKIRCTNNSQMITKAFVEPNQNVLIFEITAKLNTNIYLQHPSWGNSNTVTIDLQPYGEYTLMARRNISTIAPSQSVSSTPATPATPATTKTYKVGDYYNENGKQGVVFEVSADGKSGKIVSMTQTVLQWSSDITEQKRLIGASSQTDGAYNMAKVKAIPGWQDKYPAFKWCADLGEGWYLPSMEELLTISTNREKLNFTLTDKPTEVYYWSSTEINEQFGGELCATFVNITGNYTNFFSKSRDFNVRAVATFGDFSKIVSVTPIVSNTTTKTYKVGDYYNDGKKEGVVFEVSADGKSGKIVSMKHSTKGLKWYYGGYTNYGNLIGADDDVNGLYNMEKVMAISGWQDKYPAFKWCADLGEGWYLPSIEELKKILFCENFNKINDTIKSQGGDILLSSEYYWSSTQAEVLVNNTKFTGARRAYVSTKHEGATFPNTEHLVRAVTTFGSNATSYIMQSKKVLTSAPYKVGDYYNDGIKKGVVFEVSADGKHGKIISLIASRAINWAEEKDAKRLIGADNRTDGTYNMNKVQSIKDWKTKYPAFSWCAKLGISWYIPAIEELQKFTIDSTICNAINHTLKSMGYLELPNSGWYWSSTESEQKYKGIYSVLSVAKKLNKIDNLEKSYYYGTVRAVAKF